MGVSWRVVEWLRKSGHEALHARDVGCARARDVEVFHRAAAEGSIILTFDLDFGEVAALCPGARTGVVLFRLTTRGLCT
jgi:predicted nuclease of predicted toxin-antitoxin system